MSAMPYRKKPLAKAPSRKYFSAASLDRASRRAEPTRMYSASEKISRPRKMVMKSLAFAMTIMPAVASSSSAT